MSTDTNFMSVMDAHAQDRVSLESIKRAAERIKCHVHNTPIMTCSYLDSLVGDEKELFFKCENFQKTGSFKVSTITTFLWCKFWFSLYIMIALCFNLENFTKNCTIHGVSN